LAELFGGAGRRAMEPVIAADTVGRQSPVASLPSDVTNLAQEAQRRYQAAIQAQRDLDWARYGEEMRRLGAILEEIGGER
jgi:uncharacterized membrane protein (UPF0182 family)